MLAVSGTHFGAQEQGSSERSDTGRGWIVRGPDMKVFHHVRGSSRLWVRCWNPHTYMHTLWVIWSGPNCWLKDLRTSGYISQSYPKDSQVFLQVWKRNGERNFNNRWLPPYHSPPHPWGCFAVLCDSSCQHGAEFSNKLLLMKQIILYHLGLCSTLPVLNTKDIAFDFFWCWQQNSLARTHFHTQTKDVEQGIGSWSTITLT